MWWDLLYQTSLINVLYKPTAYSSLSENSHPYYFYVCMGINEANYKNLDGSFQKS